MSDQAVSSREATARGEAPRREGPIRRLYHWVLGWADRPSGPAALFTIATAESFFFPIPPDVLLIPLTLGAVLGGMIGYLIGSGLYQSIGQPLLEFYGYMEHYDKLGGMYSEHLILTLGTAGFTPIPYKVFTIAAGAFGVSFPAFVAISAVSRGARFFLVAGLIRLFGDPMRRFIERWFDLLTIALVVALVGGFVAIRLFLS